MLDETKRSLLACEYDEDGYESARPDEYVAAEALIDEGRAVFAWEQDPIPGYPNRTVRVLRSTEWGRKALAVDALIRAKGWAT